MVRFCDTESQRSIPTVSKDSPAAMARDPANHTQAHNVRIGAALNATVAKINRPATSSLELARAATPGRRPTAIPAANAAATATARKLHRILRKRTKVSR
jgi:hypothetical protein